MEQDLSPLEKIKAMWYALFILRGWRWFIRGFMKKAKLAKTRAKYNLTDNFISSLNAYTCVELNAQILIVT